MAASADEEDEEMFLKNMCLIIANSDVIVKSQQRDEPDLTVEQKVDILNDISRKNPGSFLGRFGHLLSSEHLSYFEKVQKDNYEVEYRLKELRKLLDDKKRHVQIQNRRYEALKRLKKDTDYFEENEMRMRDPLLYEQYIGQYLTDEERIALNSAEQSSNPTLSGFLIQRFDCQQTALRFHYQQEREEEMCEEEEEDEDGDDDEENDKDMENGKKSLVFFF